jgi:NTE family protein
MIDTLVFSGGGIKGIGFVGCLNCLLDKGIYKKENIKKIIGTSAGSIIATFLAIGYSIKEINDLAVEINFGLIRDISAENILNFFQDYGLDSGKELERIMDIIIKKKLKENLTFKELYDTKGIELVINAVCVNDQTVEYFNYKNYPDLKISKAIRMSSSIPIVFKPVEFNNKLYIDGGILDNLSVNLCDDNFLGFYIVNFNTFEKIKSIDEYLYAIITSMINHLNNDKYHQNKENIISIDISNINPINFELSKEEKITMIEKCYKVTENFINNKNNFEKGKKINKGQNFENTKTKEKNTEHINHVEENLENNDKEDNIIEQIIKDINFDHPIYIENSSLNDIIKEIRADKIKNYLTK